MTGITITVEYKDEALTTRLAALMGRLENREPFFARIGDRLLLSVSDNFRNEAGPDGTPWARHAAATVRARMRAKQLPLTILRSNRKGVSGSSLAASIRRVATNDELLVGSPKPYAAIHQLGGTISKPAGSRWMAGRRFARKADAPGGREVGIGAHAITIPARPYLGLSQADEAMIRDEVEDWLTL